MHDDKFTIRTMAREEVDIAVDWAAAEGWNPGLDDADCFRAADPEGFLVGCLGDEPIATISVVKYGEGFGFLGFYIVRPEYRGRGHGIAIWKEGMKRLGGRNIGLDGVLDQQPNYRKSGFKLAHRNIRFEGRFEEEDPFNLPVPDAEMVLAYDRPFFPADRSGFIQCWIRPPGRRVLSVVRDGVLAGYGAIRECRSGFKIGPLFADDPEAARMLFHDLRSVVPVGEPVYLDVPEANPEALALAEENGMESMFETARMYTREQPELPLERMYGITTFELG